MLRTVTTITTRITPNIAHNPNINPGINCERATGNLTPKGRLHRPSAGYSGLYVCSGGSDAGTDWNSFS